MTELQRPRISVLICAHNEEQFIGDAISSVRSQSVCSELEVIVVDDRSTDGTGDRVRELVGDDSRFRLITRTATAGCEDASGDIHFFPSSGYGGQTDALNLGLRFCNGNYIARLDADDECEPDRLSRQLQYMERHSEIGFLGGGAIRVSASGGFLGDYHSEALSHEEIVDRIRNFRAYCVHSSWFVRYSVYKRLCGYHHLGFRAEDLDFMLRAIEAGTRFAFDPTPVVRLRMREDSISAGKANLTPTIHAISALARHWIRIHGRRLSEEDERCILARIASLISNSDLPDQIAAYDALRNFYIFGRSGQFRRAVSSLAKSFSYSPKVLFNYRSLQRARKGVAEKVVQEWQSGSPL